jgi:MFS family permease
LTSNAGKVPAAPRLFTGPFLVLSGFYFLVFFAGYQLLAIVPLHLRDLGSTLAESGRFMGAFTLGSALGSLVTGPLGDRLGQRRVLRVASILLVAFFLAYALMPMRWGFIALAPLHGFVWAGLRTASITMAGSMLTSETRAEGMSFFGTSGPLGIAVGPTIGLALWPRLGFTWMLALLGAIFLVCHLVIKRLPRDAQEHQGGAPFGLPGREVLLPVILLFLVGITFGPFPPYSPQEAKGLHMLWPGAFLTSLALGIVGLRIILAFRGMGSRPIRLLRPMLWLALAGLVALTFLPGGATRHILSGCLYGAGFGMVHTLVFMHVINRSPAERRGAGVGALYFSYDAGQGVGALLIGGVMERAGAHWGVAAGYRWGWGAGALALAACLFLAGPIIREGLAKAELA